MVKLNGGDGLNSEVDVNGKDGLTGEVNLNGKVGVTGEDGLNGEVDLNGKDGLNCEVDLNSEDGLNGEVDDLNSEEGLNGEADLNGEVNLNDEDGLSNEVDLNGEDGLNDEVIDLNGEDGLNGEVGVTGEDSQVLETDKDVNCVVEWSDNEHVVEEIDNSAPSQPLVVVQVCNVPLKTSPLSIIKENDGATKFFTGLGTWKLLQLALSLVQNMLPPATPTRATEMLPASFTATFNALEAQPYC